MTHTLTRATCMARLLAAAQADPRIAGVLDYGSASEGRGDEWSDADIVLFVRDADLPEFERGWRGWLAQLGPVLLAYTSGLGKPWAVLDATPLPLRADFNFYPAGEIDRILAWPCAPRSVGHMVLYDATDGAISQRVARIVGQPLGPADPQAAFEQVCGDFWYYALRTWAKLLRRQWPVARHEYAAIMLGNLAALLRLEAGATERWRNSSAMQGIEQAIAPARLAQLERCFADADPADLARAFGAATWLAQDVCGAIGARHSWPWPADLAARVVALSSADT